VFAARPRAVASAASFLVLLTVLLAAACQAARPSSITGTPSASSSQLDGFEVEVDPALLPGAPMPGDFSVRAYQGAEAIGGETVDLSRVVGHGRPVVLNFWGGLCPPCRDEMPAFQRAHERTGDRVLFLGVDVGPFVGLGGRQDARDLIATLGVTYPNGWTFNSRALKDYRLRGIPSTWFFHGDGTVYRVWNGFIPEDELGALVDGLAAGG
jgi:thiol-disulfide isomerase/thioredoxin